MRRITQEDVARRCGVTRSTVSLVFRNDPQIPPTTAERIRAVATELGYTTGGQHAARRLIARRYGRTVLNQAILLLLPSFYHRANYFSRLIEGVQDVLMTERVLSITCTPEMLEHGPIELPPMLADAEYDGILYYSGTRDIASILSMLQKITGQDLPLVSMLGKTPLHEHDITNDEQQGAYLAIQHLLALGHRHILMPLAGSGLPIWDARYAGAERALRDAGLDPQCCLHRGDWYLGNMTPPHHLEVGEQSATSDDEYQFIFGQTADFLRYITAHPEITAILAQNDALARRIAYMLKSINLRVPEDISLVGFDDADPLLDDNGRNILTAVHLPLEAVGATAARSLLQWIRHQTPPSPVAPLTPELVVRGSTAPPRQ